METLYDLFILTDLFVAWGILLFLKGSYLPVSSFLILFEWVVISLTLYGITYLHLNREK